MQRDCFDGGFVQRQWCIEIDLLLGKVVTFFCYLFVEIGHLVARLIAAIIIVIC